MKPSANTSTHSSNMTVGTIELVLAMMLSGTIGYFVISSEQSLWNVIFFRCVIGSVVMGGYAYYCGMIRREFFQRSLFLMILLGGITLVGNWIFLFASFNYIPFSIATVTYHMQPLFLVITGALLTKEKLPASLLFWLAMAFLGLFLIVELDVDEISALFSSTNDTESQDGGVSSPLVGLLLALGASLLYTATTLITKKVSQVPSAFVALIQVIVGIFILLPFVNFDRLPTQTSQWIDIFILGSVLTGFMYIIVYDSIQRLPTNLIALLSFIYPVTALFVDYFAFSNTISGLQGVGVLLVLLAVCAVKFNWSLPSTKAATEKT